MLPLHLLSLRSSIPFHFAFIPEEQGPRCSKPTVMLPLPLRKFVPPGGTVAPAKLSCSLNASSWGLGVGIACSCWRYPLRWWDGVREAWTGVVLCSLSGVVCPSPVRTLQPSSWTALLMDPACVAYALLQGLWHSLGSSSLCDPVSSAQPLAFGVEKSRSCSEKTKSGGIVVAFGGFTLVLQGDISPWCSYLLRSHLFSWTTSWPCAFCSARWPRASSSQASHSQSSFCFGCLSPLKWGASITMDPPVTRREHIP